MLGGYIKRIFSMIENCSTGGALTVEQLVYLFVVVGVVLGRESGSWCSLGQNINYFNHRQYCPCSR